GALFNPNTARLNDANRSQYEGMARSALAQYGQHSPGAMDMMQGAAMGQAPSQGQAMLQQGADASMRQAAALAASNRSMSPGAAQRMAQDAQLQATQQVAN